MLFATIIIGQVSYYASLLGSNKEKQKQEIHRHKLI